MYRMQLGFALAAALGTGSWWSPALPTDLSWPTTQEAASEPDGAPRAPWLQGDPADSLYRAAREALNRQDFRKAADLFAQIPARYPKSGYAADAYYWQAFALYRLPGGGSLAAARDALRRQRERFPEAATKGDAAALEQRINGELARRGDPEARAEITRVASGVGEPPVPPTPPHGSRPPEAPEPPEPPHAMHGSHDGDCDEEGDDERTQALMALLNMDGSKARPILQRVLARRDAASVCLRRKAVFIISQGDDSGTEDILLASARTDPDQGVREQAIFWLSQVGSAKAVTALDSILRSSTDRQIQDKAIFALSQQDDPKARQSLRAFAERADAPEGLREQAIFWIGQSGGKENEAYLRELFGRLKNEDLRKKVLFSVSQMGGSENLKWLIGIARDRAQPLEVRKQALFWAGQGDASMADLAPLYVAFDDREMKDQLIFVYSQRDETAAVDKLLEIARKDPDPELRKKALFWLGQSDDPRAAKALQEIIEQP